MIAAGAGIAMRESKMSRRATRYAGLLAVTVVVCGEHALAAGYFETRLVGEVRTATAVTETRISGARVRTELDGEEVATTTDERGRFEVELADRLSRMQAKADVGKSLRERARQVWDVVVTVSAPGYVTTQVRTTLPRWIADGRTLRIYLSPAQATAPLLADGGASPSSAR